MNNRIDYTAPTTQYAFDLNSSLFHKKDERNFINVVSQNELNTLLTTSLLDIYLSTHNVIEPHYHQSAAELVYCISGAVNVSLLNPFTNKLISYALSPGQVINIPRGWWHFEIATTDNTHLLAIFDSPMPDTILGSDLLRLTPSSIMAHTYCLNEQDWINIISPIQESLIIGPKPDCQ